MTVPRAPATSSRPAVSIRRAVGPFPPSLEARRCSLHYGPQLLRPGQVRRCTGVCQATTAAAAAASNKPDSHVSRPVVRCRPAAAAAPANQPVSHVSSPQRAVEPPPPPPRSLPPPPAAGSLLHVLRYSFRICLTADAWALPRLVAVFGLLFVSRVASFAIPMYFKQAVEAAGCGSAARPELMRALLLAGACRMLAGVCRDLQSPVFTLVSQAAGRRMAYHGMAHVLRLGPEFHSNSSTGALTRVIDRGTKSISAMCRSIVFRFVPTTLELVAVCSVLSRRFSPEVGAIVAATSAAYVAFTAAMTQAAVLGKQAVKRQDNAINAKTVEILLNYETIALSGRQKHEAASFGVLLEGFQDASIRFEYMTGFLTAVQAVILGVGLTAALAAVASQSGTAGDLVLVQGLLLQLWAPLVSVGGLYRRLRKSLVDLEDFVAVLRLKPKPLEGTRSLPELATRPVQQQSPPLPPPLQQQQQQQWSQHEGAAPEADRAALEADRAALGADIASAGSLPCQPPADVHVKGLQGIAGRHDQPQHGSSNGAAPPLQQPSAGGRDAAARGSRRERPAPAAGPASSGGRQHQASAGAKSRVPACSEAGGSGGSGAGGHVTASPPETDAAAPMETPGGLQVEFRDVSFGYNPGQRQLSGLTFRIRPGESIGIVGPPGSGKSTVLRLILRLYDVGAGAVLLNGVDVRDLRHEALHDAVATVPQHVCLVNGSVADNIAFGWPDADDSALQAAAGASNLDSAIAVMPTGYGTQVGERGLKVSGGEKQRIAIARALVRKPRLLLCDEATSALDRGSEAGVLRTLMGGGGRGRTTIILAHRLAAVAACDRVLVLQGGSVAHEGTHAQLLRRCEWYAAAWVRQHVSPHAADA